MSLLTIWERTVQWFANVDHQAEQAFAALDRDLTTAEDDVQHLYERVRQLEARLVPIEKEHSAVQAAVLAKAAAASADPNVIIFKDPNQVIDPPKAG